MDNFEQKIGCLLLANAKNLHEGLMTIISIRQHRCSFFAAHLLFVCLLNLSISHLQSTQALGADVTINDGSGVTSYSSPLAHNPEVHVIGVYETNSNHGHGFHPTGYADVAVKYNGTEPMQPITLVLSSYEPNEWRLNIDPGAVIDQIVLNGFYAQSVTGTGDIPIVC